MTIPDEITNTENVIDSRDVIARIEYLESEREDAEDKPEFDDSDEGHELEALKALAEEASGYASDWQYGEALIADDYFTEYAQQMAEDIGAVKSDAVWPNNCIDWEKAAELLQQDYTSVDFDGATYWIR